MSDDPRKQYWSKEYAEYWRARVNEAGVGTSNVVEGDSRTEDDDIYRAVFESWPFQPGSVVDVGCAWGRLFPLYLEYGLEVTGLDISTPMVEAARAEWGENPRVVSVVESSAEQTPFPHCSFDNLVCLAVFDATWQDQAITEFLRITRPGARLYITGKNTNYCDDDEAALAAEVGARSKGHPNFFTRTRDLINLLETNGHRLLQYYLFPRRGDFAAFSHSTRLDREFYEYLLVIERGPDYSPVPEISEEYSATFRRLRAASEN